MIRRNFWQSLKKYCTQGPEPPERCKSRIMFSALISKIVAYNESRQKHHISTASYKRTISLHNERCYLTFMNTRTFAVLSVTNKSSRAWVTCNCVCFLNATNSGKARIAAAIPDDDVTMRACKPHVTLARVVVYEIYARS